MPLLRRFGRPGLLGLAARTAVVAGTATAVTGAVVGHRRNKAQAEYEQEQYEAAQQQAALQDAADRAVGQAPPAATQQDDVVAELQKLAALQQQGALSSEEFAAAKAKLLA